MKRWIIVSWANICLWLLHSAGLFVAHSMGISKEELAKLVPTTIASALSASIATTVALMHIFKSRKPKWECTARNESWGIYLTINGVNNFPQAIQLTAVSVPLFSDQLVSGKTSCGAGEPLFAEFFLTPIGDPEKDKQIASQLTRKRNLTLRLSYKRSGFATTLTHTATLRNPLAQKRVSANSITSLRRFLN